MLEQPDPAPPVPPAQELLCYACGYNLLGQPEEGRCPECGLEVRQTLQRVADLHAFSDPPSAKRSASMALISLGIIVSWTVVQTVLFAFIFANQVPPRWIEHATVLLTLAASLGSTITAGVAATRLGLVRVLEGRINRRLLLASAWVLPATIVTLWLFVGAIYLELFDDFFWPMMIAMQVILMIMFLAAGLLSVTYVGELRRRVRMWPRSGGLAMILTGAWVALLLSFAGNASLMAASLAETALGWWFAPRLQTAMMFTGVASAVLFVGGIVALSGCLVLVLKRKLPADPLSRRYRHP